MAFGSYQIIIFAMCALRCLHQASSSDTLGRKYDFVVASMFACQGGWASPVCEALRRSFPHANASAFCPQTGASTSDEEHCFDVLVPGVFEKAIEAASSGHRTLFVGRLGDWRPKLNPLFVKALKVGVAFILMHDFHFVDVLMPDIVGAAFNETEFPDMYNRSLVLNIEPSADQGKEFLGAEWCRLAGNVPQRVIATYLWHRVDMTNRVNGILASFRKHCPETELSIAANFSTDYDAFAYLPGPVTSLLLRDASITAALATHDYGALALVEGIDAALGETAGRKIFVSSWDYAIWGQKLMRERRIFADVDQGLQIPNQGLYGVMKKLITMLENAHVNTTRQAFKVLGADSTTLFVPMKRIPRDIAGYLDAVLMPKYSRNIHVVNADSSPLPVGVGVEDLKIATYDFGSGSFSAVFWYYLEWFDVQLQWDPVAFNGSLEFPLEKVWHPHVFFPTASTHEVLFQSPVSVTAAGQVSFKTRVSAILDCNIRSESYPLTVQVCGVEIAVSEPPQEIVLQPHSDFVVVSTPVDHDLPKSTRVFSKGNTTVVFESTAEKLPGFVFLCHMFPAYLLNIISFTSFYLPGHDDRVGLGITAVLAQMVLQTEARVSKVMTWMDVFLNVSLAYQIVAFTACMLARRESVADPEKLGCDVRGVGFVRQLHHAVFGCADNFIVDLWSRRVIVPSFLLITMILCFIPWWGEMDITTHKNYGFGLWMFWTSLFLSAPIATAALLHVYFASRGELPPRGRFSQQLARKSMESDIGSFPQQLARRSMESDIVDNEVTQPSREPAPTPATPHQTIDMVRNLHETLPTTGTI